MRKKCGREPMAHSRTGEQVCTRPRRPCSHAFFISRRSGVSPDCENATPTPASGLKPPTRKAKRQRYISGHRSKRLFHARAEILTVYFLTAPAPVTNKNASVKCSASIGSPPSLPGKPKSQHEEIVVPLKRPPRFYAGFRPPVRNLG